LTTPYWRRCNCHKRSDRFQSVLVQRPSQATNWRRTFNIPGPTTTSASTLVHHPFAGQHSRIAAVGTARDPRRRVGHNTLVQHSPHAAILRESRTVSSVSARRSSRTPPKVPVNNMRRDYHCKQFDPISATPRSKFCEANLFTITKSKAYIAVVYTASKAATPLPFLPTHQHCFLTAMASRSSSSAAVAWVSDARVPVAHCTKAFAIVAEDVVLCARRTGTCATRFGDSGQSADMAGLHDQ
jgi:hypothetical protein